MNKNIVIIETEIMNAVLEFLAKQAFKEVAGLINAIQQSAEKNKEKPEPEVAPEYPVAE